nr:reverse transcriptase domain-containing protein [Tanacetum cinerariifolium]
MRTRSRSRHKIAEPLRIEFPSQEDQFQEDPPEVPMADNQTMAQLLQAPIVGYEDAIVIPEIAATNFELKHGLINLVQNKQFFGHDKEDPHTHIRYFNKITSTMRVPNVPNLTIKLMLFPFSLEGAARIWLEKEPPRSILTWDDLVSKFINQFFPPSKTTNLQKEITRFQQRFDESFSEAWDRFNDLLRACPHHGFSELQQLDTFYNALNVNDQDSLNSAAGGNFFDKMHSDCLKIIESKSKVRQSRAKAVVSKVNSSSSTSAISSDVAKLKDMVRALLLDKKNQSSAPAPSPTPSLVKVVESNCVICGGTGTLPGNTITNPKEDLKVTKDQVQTPSSQSTAHVQPPVTQSETLVFEPVVAPISAPMPNLKLSIPYPSRRNNERRREQANEQIDKFYEILKDMSFEISFTDALIHMPNLTPSDDPTVSTTSPTLTTFRDSDFLLFKEANAFLGLEDDPDSPKLDPSYYDPDGDILMLEAILNSDPAPSLPDHEQFVPSFKNELKACEAKTIKSSVDEPPEVELKDLPPHLEYTFLKGDNKLPVIIAKELGDEEKAALIKVEKLLDARLIYPISDSPWASPVHCVPKKGGFTVVKNEENELIPTRLVTGWRVCINYRKLNKATRKDHFPLTFMDQMLERLAGNEYYCFLDGFSGYFQIPIDPRDQEKTTFTCPYGTFAYRRMPFGLCNAPGTFQRCMLAIFHDMVEKRMEVFMDDFSVFG